tara:strand:+ start:22 stop:540 length:519 start_codon:yes stop_codon:yes gene_type:complete
MINNNIFFFLIFLFLTQCGYETIYSSKNIKFNVKEIKIENNLNIGRQIKNRLEIFSSDNSSNENYILNINSYFNKTTASKDKQGNPKTFNINVTVNVTFINNENIKKNKSFIENINYNNDENKFSLKKYENSLMENLTDKIIEDLLIYLQIFSSEKSNASLTGNIGYTGKKQ